MDGAGRTYRSSSPGPANRAGKLPALKEVHEARLTAHSALCEALLKIHSGSVAAATKSADALLRRVRAPEFDLTGLTPAEANCVKRMPAEAWVTLQQYAEASNEVGITSVALSSEVNVDTRLLDGLARLHVQHLALGRGISDTLMARLQTLPFLEHLTQRGPTQGLPEYAALQQQRAAQKPEAALLPSASRPPRTVKGAMKAGNGRETGFFVGAIPIVATPQGPRTAAQLAMQNGHPLAAAAMWLAILECHLGSDEKLELLAMLGVSRVEIDTALSMPELQRTPLVSEMNRLWKAGWEALALMAGDARVALKDAAGAKPTVLRAERMWTKGSGLVLCSAAREIPQLRFHGVSQNGLEAEGRLCYALAPDWLVKHTGLLQL